MKSLETLYQAPIKNAKFIPRKYEIIPPKTLIIGAISSGKTALVYEFLSHYKSEERLYINLDDIRIDRASLLANLKEFLEKKVYEIEPADKKDQIGLVNGLAWTSVGGDVLRIEAIRIQGKGNMQITGQLGDVMKESAQIAFSVVKVLIDNKKLKVPMAIVPKLDDDKHKLEASDVYRRYDLHLHVPEGAVPKDGPSAGITMATAIASILTDTKVKHDIAMTGEITLTGRVLPIGGLKEKLIAAHKAGIKTALIPRKNYDRDLVDIPAEVKADMKIIAVDTIDDVLKNALVAKK